MNRWARLYSGNIAAIILVASFFLIFLFVARTNSIVDTWRIMGVDNSMTPRFADLRVVLAGAECYEMGIDPLTDNPCDPLGRILPYPRIWSTTIAATGLNQQDTDWLGLLVGLSFLISAFLMIGRMTLVEGLLFGAIMISPPVLLALERANIDLIIFSMLFIGTSFLISNKVPRIYKEILGIGILLIAALLKYYPIFALLITGTLPRIKRFAWIAVVIFLLYLSCNLGEFYLCNAGVSKDIVPAFGAITLASYLSPARFDYLSSPWNSMNFAILSACLSLISLCLALLLRSSKAWGFTIDATRREFLLFCIGSSIFIGCYLTSTSFDYRLIFLLFCLPQIFLWRKSKKRQEQLMSYALWAGILFSFSLSTLSYATAFADEWLNLILYFGLSSILLLGILQAQTGSIARLINNHD